MAHACVAQCHQPIAVHKMDLPLITSRSLKPDKADALTIIVKENKRDKCGFFRRLRNCVSSYQRQEIKRRLKYGRKKRGFRSSYPKVGLLAGILIIAIKFSFEILLN